MSYILIIGVRVYIYPKLYKPVLWKKLLAEDINDPE